MKRSYVGKLEGETIDIIDFPAGITSMLLGLIVIPLIWYMIKRKNS